MRPADSPDAAVRAVLVRRDGLAAEVVRIDAALEAYAAAFVARPAGPVVPLIRHFAMTDGTACGCGVCSEWRSRQDELAAALRLVPDGHRWSVCACADCRFVGRLQFNYRAASNLRDSLIEVAYHARFGSEHGEKVMEWFERERLRPKYTVEWCAYELGRRPVDEWLDLCESALAPVVSGAVFARGMREAA